MRVDLSGLVGIPFVDGGRDIFKGVDCWGLFVEAQKRFGNDVPDFTVSAFDTKAINDAYQHESGGWVQVSKPLPGDAVVMAIDPARPEDVQHFGVCIDGNRFLHTLTKRHSHLSRLDDPFFSRKIRGFYRWAG